MIRNFNKLSDIIQVTALECMNLKSIEDKYAFGINDYYLSLINWDDPNDPIRKICIPSVQEKDFWGSLNVSNEKYFTVLPGLEHKYKDTVVIILNYTCAGYCRFCYRKRLLKKKYLPIDLKQRLKYIRNNSDIRKVILSGGDPLMMQTPKLRMFLTQLSEISHVQIVQIETKIPAFNPYRILFDPAFTEMLSAFNNSGLKVYMDIHINHPSELTKEALRAIGLMKDSGTVISNKTPILRGVNDNPDILATLLDKLSTFIVSPLEIFQLVPIKGNKHFRVPIEEAFQIVTQAGNESPKSSQDMQLFILHPSGKIEVTNLSENNIAFKYIKPVLPDNLGRELQFVRNPQAYGLHDYFPILPG